MHKVVYGQSENIIESESTVFNIVKIDDLKKLREVLHRVCLLDCRMHGWYMWRRGNHFLKDFWSQVQ